MLNHTIIKSYQNLNKIKLKILKGSNSFKIKIDVSIKKSVNSKNQYHV